MPWTTLHKLISSELFHHSDGSSGVNNNDTKVTDASAILQISEYRFFQIAYRQWYGSEGDTKTIDYHFGRYLHNNPPPHWVRSLARRVIKREINPAELGIKIPVSDRTTRIKGILLLILIGLLCIGFYIIVIKEYTPYF
ncbi:MAG: hypothetical protein D6726_07300 [Nitrospirae bacterium]|nr:MAG: hypothetical protein D6726_07300 [Nitrospirota bacterium]